MPRQGLSYLKEIVIGVVAAAVSATFVAVTQSYWVTVLGIEIPFGLVLGSLFCLAICSYLARREPLKVIGSLLPLIAFMCAYTPLFGLYAGNGQGGGVMLPAVLLGKPVWTGTVGYPLGVVVALLFIWPAWPRDRKQSS